MEICDAAFEADPYLLPFKGSIKTRNQFYQETRSRIEDIEGSLYRFARGTDMYGLRRVNDRWSLCEYLPGADEVSLVGDFNGWNRSAMPMTKGEFGRWFVEVDESCGLCNGQRFKLSILCRDGSVIERNSAWSSYVVQNPQTNLFDGVVWSPLQSYVPKFPRPSCPDTPRIYEAHIGMSSSEEKVSTYKEFQWTVLPRIVRLGYNTIQLMAVMEHAYYGSFGYHVTSFFAPSSRFGTPDDLRELIDVAHGMGLVVLMDIVHSHMSGNHLDGLACMDGTDHCYTHSGSLGRHDLWDSALFDYDKWEVLRFLLSNCRYWIEDIGFDGFRFDGITSMLYKHHGIGVGFSGDYHEYFGETVDMSACVYLMLANELIHSLLPKTGSISIAEDVSGMPLLCRPISEGGIGFDFRLAMAVPDMWIKLLKECRDEDWNMGNIVHTLTNRRWNERTIAYAESHDQSIVGDKTIAMWLMDASMYTEMRKSSASLVVDRGISLHKLIRLISLALGNNGYLTFMGNEFGHPEWVDFPREGNDWSYQLCRRQWDLTDRGDLRYSGLERFDAAIMALDAFHSVLAGNDQHIFLKDEARKVIAFERGRLLFAFNFHPTDALVDFPVPTRISHPMKVVLDSDEPRFGGLGGRISHSENMMPRDGFLKVYIPPRCCAVYSDTQKVSADITVTVPSSLKGSTIQFMIDDVDTAKDLWQALVVETETVEFPAAQGLRLFTPKLLPFGVSQNSNFTRAQAFEISLPGRYRIDCVGRLTLVI